MAKHNETGQFGEKLALEYLEAQGYSILETNWRHGRSEVDIIAKDRDILVFIEVKTRSYDYFGKPEEFVDKQKEKHLAKAAAAYMELKEHEWEIRFDVISILKKKNGKWQLELLKDAFFPGIE
jgi:putative endonuclease